MNVKSPMFAEPKIYDNDCDDIFMSDYTVSCLFLLCNCFDGLVGKSHSTDAEL